MQKHDARTILQNSRFDRWRLVAMAFFACILLTALTLNGSVDYYVQTKLLWPINFKIRELLNLGPSLAPNIKVFALDDSTVALLKRSYLNLDEWAKVISMIGERRPKVIVIDKIFGIADTSDQMVIARAQKILGDVKTKVVAGSFIAPRPIQFRPTMNIEGNDYKLDAHIRAGSDTLSYAQNRPRIPLAPGTNVYGPIPELRERFSGVGHLHYNADHRIAPFFNLGRNKVIPYVGTLIANSAQYRGGRLHLDDTLVPTLRDGYVPLNFISPKIVKSRIRSLRGLLTNDADQWQQTLKTINSNDIVVILPMMFTGNTDFKDTPFGMSPAGYSLVAFANSYATNQWLKPIDQAPLVILMASCFAVFLCSVADGVLLLLLTAFFQIAFTAIGVCLFAYYTITMPWLYAVVTLSIVNISVIIYRSRLAEARARVLRYALDGALAPQNIKFLARSGSSISLEAREHVVTIVFIDVVGYSLLSENQIPRVAFDQLKLLLATLADEVHAFGGMVNKTLGDGLLCIFGYEFETQAVTTDHAEKAVAAAISIQEKNLKANLQAVKRGEPVYPLRIGIHTASVFLGDLGSGDRIDFTAVGNGVNYAKRMEQACDLHSILFSATTKDLTASLALNSQGLRKKMISIKHHTNQIEAFEYDPFYLSPEVRTLAIEGYRQCASLARTEQRFSINFPDAYTIRSSVGIAHIINYSATGISIRLKSSLVKGSVLSLSIDSTDLRLGQQLRDLGVGEIISEVRWAYSDTDGSVHGLFYRNLNEEMAARLVETIRNFDLALKLSRSSSKLAV